jgi:hypothetical protein
MEYPESSEEECIQINALRDIQYLAVKKDSTAFKRLKDLFDSAGIAMTIEKEPNGSHISNVTLSHPDLDAVAMRGPMILEGYVSNGLDEYNLYLSPERTAILPKRVNFTNGYKNPQMRFSTTLDKDKIPEQVGLFLEALINNIKK